MALILMTGQEGQGDRERGYPGSLPERLGVREVQKEWLEQNLGAGKSSSKTREGGSNSEAFRLAGRWTYA